MTDVKRLLEQATPLPWEFVEPHSIVHHPQEPEVSHAVWNVAAIEGLFSVRHHNAALIVHAVNALPDYEAVADAARAVINSLKVLSATEAVIDPDKYADLAESLARLRKQVAA